jgi:hypothetical protein
LRNCLLQAERDSSLAVFASAEDETERRLGEIQRDLRTRGAHNHFDLVREFIRTSNAEDAAAEYLTSPSASDSKDSSPAGVTCRGKRLILDASWLDSSLASQLEAVVVKAADKEFAACITQQADGSIVIGDANCAGSVHLCLCVRDSDGCSVHGD